MIPIEIQNRQLGFKYSTILSVEAGISLLGREVKALRTKRADIVNAYVTIIGKEAFLKNMSLQEQITGKQLPVRDIKLLMHKKEIAKFLEGAKKGGNTIAIGRIYTNKRGLFKAQVCLCKGKSKGDKRIDIKKRDIDRQNRRDNKFNY